MVTLPLDLGYGPGSAGLVDFSTTDMIVDYVFLLDVLVAFRTGFQNLQGVEVLEWELVGKRYLRGWFALDVVSCPDAYLAWFGSENQPQWLRGIKLLKTTKFLKAMKLFRLSKLQSKWAENFEEAHFSNTSAQARNRIVKMVVQVMSVAHVLGCLWASVSQARPDEAVRHCLGPWRRPNRDSLVGGRWAYFFEVGFGGLDLDMTDDAVRMGPKTDGYSTEFSFSDYQPYFIFNHRSVAIKL